MKKVKSILFAFLVTAIMMSGSCNNSGQQTSDSGVQKASVKIKTDEHGMTSEQNNVAKRLVRDNEIGAVKFLYVVSAYTGDVLEQSTVVGKVTSGGKRLSPKTVNGNGMNNSGNNMWVYLDGQGYTTNEVLDDGGTYGDSGPYLFWFDANDEYHQYYPSGGTYLHISEKPLRVRKANMTFELIEKPAKQSVDSTKK